MECDNTLWRTRSFHNTNDSRGRALAQAEEKAKPQEERILDLFVKNPHAYFDAYRVRNALNMQATPITSIRRAITNLANNGDIIKTAVMVRGEFGVKCYTWRYLEEDSNG